MDFQTHRQLSAFIIAALLIIAGAFVAFQIIVPDASCRDNIRNQQEEEVDCGGQCIPCSLKNPEDVEIFWVRFFETRDNTYDVVAEIRNPNVGVGVYSFDYELELIDSTNKSAVVRAGRSFIYPNETTHISEIAMQTERVVRSARLTISNEVWTISDAAPPDMIAGSKEYQIEDSAGIRQGVVSAVVSNRTVRDMENITVHAIVLDAEGNVMGVNQTLIDRIAAGQSQPVKFIWPTLFPKSPSSLIVEPRSRINIPAPGE